MGGGTKLRIGNVAGDLAGDWDKKERMGELVGEVGIWGAERFLGV
jgi:hypothetical protein